ncbi:hypothetical protein COP1_031086 [Malus domestica]
MFGNGASNPSMSLRNMILSPIDRPQLCRCPQIFTLEVECSLFPESHAGYVYRDSSDDMVIGMLVAPRKLIRLYVSLLPLLHFR